MGVFFSPVLLSIVGIRILFLDNHLFDRRLWGSRASDFLAALGPNRSYYRCPDVRPICRFPLCYRYATHRERITDGIGPNEAARVCCVN